MDVGELLVRVGLRVAELRLARGLTQERFAELAGIDPRDFQKIEQGATNFTMRRLVHIASVLGCDPAELLATPTTPDALPGRRKSG